MKTVNDLISELQKLRPSYRELPIVIQTPNGFETYPEIKILLKVYQTDPYNNETEKIVLSVD